MGCLYAAKSFQSGQGQFRKNCRGDGDHNCWGPTGVLRQHPLNGDLGAARLHDGDISCRGMNHVPSSRPHGTLVILYL